LALDGDEVGGECRWHVHFEKLSPVSGFHGTLPPTVAHLATWAMWSYVSSPLETELRWSHFR